MHLFLLPGWGKYISNQKHKTRSRTFFLFFQTNVKKIPHKTTFSFKHWKKSENQELLVQTNVSDMHFLKYSFIIHIMNPPP